MKEIILEPTIRKALVLTFNFNIEDLNSEDYACVHSIIWAAGYEMPKSKWVAEVKKWQTPKNGLNRGLKVVRNASGYIVASISYKVKIAENGEYSLIITGIFIPTMFKRSILKKLNLVFQTLMKEEKCQHLVVGYSDLSSKEKELFGNQLENFMGKTENISIDKSTHH